MDLIFRTVVSCDTRSSDQSSDASGNTDEVYKCPHTEKPTPSVSLEPNLCFKEKSPLADVLCAHLSLSPSRETSVMAALGVALLIVEVSRAAGDL